LCCHLLLLFPWNRPSVSNAPSFAVAIYPRFARNINVLLIIGGISSAFSFVFRQTHSPKTFFFRALSLTPSQKDSQHSRPEERRWSGSVMNYKQLFICPLRGFDFPVEYRRVNQEVLTDQRARLFMSKEEGQGLTFFLFYEPEASLSTLFLSHSFLCLSHFLLMLFLRCFSCYPCPNSFSVQRLRHWFGASSYRASYRSGESRCLFAFSLLRPIFQSDREGISLVRPPFVALTRTNSPRRHLHAPSVPFL
jgi:hypothetical protein